MPDGPGPPGLARGRGAGLTFPALQVSERTAEGPGPRAFPGIRRTPGPDHASGNQLSGGQQQRGALANDPDLLVTGNLDSRLSLEIVALIERLNREGKTILMVTHSRDLAERAERIIHRLDGRVVRDEEVSERRAAISTIEKAAG